ncbi:MAG: hypothetical protein FJX77_16380 [Armatimonadetes bacterium]|nr:hypothetical protein [Armatimonadota bacterium]
MPPQQASQPSIAWLGWSFLTVATWGVYGVLLHKGNLAMADPANGRLKAFLLVGAAYFLTAILAPLLILKLNGANWNFPQEGVKWSLIAGIMGAVGALGTLLAFGAKGSPAFVMSIVFAGAPIVNAIVAIATHPPEGGLSSIRWQFFLGLFLAAAGGGLVTLYRPMPPAAKPAAPPAQAAVAAPLER